jgi:hypothetical protein
MTELETARAEYNAAMDICKSPPEGFVTKPMRERLRAALATLETLEANVDTRPTAAELRAAKAQIEQEIYERKAQDRRYGV